MHTTFFDMLKKGYCPVQGLPVLLFHLAEKLMAALVSGRSWMFALRGNARLPEGVAGLTGGFLLVDASLTGLPTVRLRSVG